MVGDGFMEGKAKIRYTETKDVSCLRTTRRSFLMCCVGHVNICGINLR